NYLREVFYSLVMVIALHVETAQKEVCTGIQPVVARSMYNFVSLVGRNKSILQLTLIQQEFTQGQVDLGLADLIIDCLRDRICLMQRLDRVQCVFHYLVDKSELHQCRQDPPGVSQLLP